MGVEEEDSESELDEDEQELEDDESESEELEEDDELEDDEEEGDEVSLDSIVSELESRLSDRFDSIADRRVNALLKEMRKQGGTGGKPAKSEKRSDGGDVRGARLAAREYLSDEIEKYVSADERKLAMDLLSLEVEAAIGRGEDDEDEIGRMVAGKVAERIRNARKMYETKTRADLKRRGALKPNAGQPRKAGGGTSAASDFKKGADIAARIRPRVEG